MSLVSEWVVVSGEGDVVEGGRQGGMFPDTRISKCWDALTNLDFVAGGHGARHHGVRHDDLDHSGIRKNLDDLAEPAAGRAYKLVQTCPHTVQTSHARLPLCAPTKKLLLCGAPDSERIRKVGLKAMYARLPQKSGQKSQLQHTHADSRQRKFPWSALPVRCAGCTGALNAGPHLAVIAAPTRPRKAAMASVFTNCACDSHSTQRPDGSA